MKGWRIFFHTDKNMYCMLRSMGLQRVGHDLVTEQQQQQQHPIGFQTIKSAGLSSVSPTD